MADKNWTRWIRFAILIVACLTRSIADFTTDCPRPCDCKWQSGNKAAICTNASLKHVPDRLSNEIQNLELSNNPLKQLTQDAFKKVGLSNIKKLVLRDCQIEFVHKTALSSLGIMIEFDISRNKIKSLHPETFKETEKLRWVNLGNNLIDKLDDGLFRNLKYLQRVELSNNKIVRLGLQTFVNLPRLQILRLDGNNLTYMKPEALSPLGHLSSLDLDNNPWRCDCNLQPFRNWVIGHNLYTAPTSCADPPILAGKLWNELDSTSFACRPTILEPIQNAIVKTYDDNVTLICKVVGNPTPNVYWKFNNKVIEFKAYPERYVTLENTLDLIRWVNITVHNVKYTDKGNYTCIAENPGGIDERNLTLVLGKYSGDFFIDNDTLAILIGCMTAILTLTGVLVIICYFSSWRKHSKRLIKSEVQSTNGEALIDGSVASESEKHIICEVNPITKPPRKYDAPPSVTSEATEMSELNKILYENEPILASVEDVKIRQDFISLQKISQEALLADRFTDSHQTYPPDLLSFPLRGLQISPVNADRPKDSRNSVNTPVYSSNFNSLRFQHIAQSYAPIDSKVGYVTIPRKPRNRPSYTQNGLVGEFDSFGLQNQHFKSELELGSNGKILPAYHIQQPYEEDDAPSPAPGTPYASIPRASTSSPNIHNQLLALQAFAESSGHLRLASKLDRSLRLGNEDMKNPVIRMCGGSVTIGRPKMVIPKIKKLSSEMTNPFLDSLDNATQV